MFFLWQLALFLILSFLIIWLTTKGTQLPHITSYIFLTQRARISRRCILTPAHWVEVELIHAACSVLCDLFIQERTDDTVVELYHLSLLKPYNLCFVSIWRIASSFFHIIGSGNSNTSVSGVSLLVPNLVYSFNPCWLKMMNLEVNNDPRRQRVFMTMYLQRMCSLRQMDLDYSLSQMLHIILSPTKVLVLVFLISLVDTRWLHGESVSGDGGV